VQRNDLNYIWVLRCSGSSPGHSGEYRTIDYIPRNSLTPLMEIIDEGVWNRYYGALSRQFGEVYVELPLYLNEKNNKWWNEGDNRCRNINDHSCLDFFNTNEDRLDIPVVSWWHNNREIRLDYSPETQLLAEIKTNFEKVGVRIGLPSYDIQNVPLTRASLLTLLNSLDASDTLFIDVYAVGSLIQQRLSNLSFTIDHIPSHVQNIFILNAFEPDHMGHNYGPYLKRHYNLMGFGDFATEHRFPVSVKRDPRVRRFRRNIQYYNWNRFELYTFSEYDSYERTASVMRSSGIWQANPDHIHSCPACSRVASGDYNNWTVYWKEFRIKHYINSIVNETRINNDNARTAEDLDPIGHDNLFNLGGRA